jgi:hypothetical protein
VPVRNTDVANLQNTMTIDVCNATTSLLSGLDGDGSLPPETAGRASEDDVDHRRASATDRSTSVGDPHE